MHRDSGERLMECVKQESCQEKHLTYENTELTRADQSQVLLSPIPNELLSIWGQFGQDRGCCDSLLSFCDIKDESVMLGNIARLNMNSSLLCFCIVSALILSSANGLGVEVRLGW